jgi:hypothetical protein
MAAPSQIRLSAEWKLDFPESRKIQSVAVCKKNYGIRNATMRRTRSRMNHTAANLCKVLRT